LKNCVPATKDVPMRYCENAGLEDATEEPESESDTELTKTVSVEEAVAIFLYIVGRGASNRDAQERFQHSGETISR
jgi:hypothetical protein